MISALKGHSKKKYVEQMWDFDQKPKKKRIKLNRIKF